MIKNNDFVEVEFTGMIADTKEIFDTNKKSDALKANFKVDDMKPFSLAVGHKMLPLGFDEDLVDKELGKEYVVAVKPEKAFGLRNTKLVRMIPTKLFHQQQIDPQRGMQLSLDGQLVKVLSNSGGRTLVDFNNPLAGKEVVYEYKVLKMLDVLDDKINALQDFLFRTRFAFEVKDKKLMFKAEKKAESFIKFFAGKFKEILGLEVEVVLVEKKKDDKKEVVAGKEVAHNHEHHDHDGHTHAH